MNPSRAVRIADLLISNQALKGYITFVVAFILFGYPLTTGIIILFNTGLSTPFNIFFRSVYSALSLLVVLIALLHRQERLAFSRGGYLLLIFWSIYLVRLFVDIFLRDIHFAGGSDFFVFSMSIGNSLLPALAVLLVARHIDLKILFRLSFIILSLSNLVIIWQLTKGADNLADLFLTRQRIALLGGMDEQVINPITVSIFGEILALLAFHLLMNHSSGALWKRITLLGLFMVGVFNLLLGGSRGPFVFFLLLAFLILVNFFRTNSRSFKGNLRIGLLLIIFAISARIATPFIASVELNTIQRLTRLLEMGTRDKMEIRDDQFLAAWQEFLAHPITGSRFVEPRFDFYPHNILLEALMATGIIGALTFLAMCFFAFRTGMYLWRAPERISFGFLLIFGAFFLSALTSGSIFVSMEFWVITALMISVPWTEKVYGFSASQ